MDNAVKETLCTSCNHLDVCTYMNDYLYILDAVSKVSIDQQCSDGKKVYLKKVTDFDFIGDISIGCRYYQKSIAYRACMLKEREDDNDQMFKSAETGTEIIRTAIRKAIAEGANDEKNM